MNAELTYQMLSLKPGDHLCLLYEKSALEQMPALIPFIQDGLSQGEQFIYIVDDQTVEELAHRLEQNGLNVREESARGALKLCTRQDWRQPGELDSDQKSLQVRQFTHEAQRQGFKGIRFAVDMTWTLGPDIPTDQLEHWEATLNNLFKPAFPGRIICQYNASRLTPETMLVALYTHPIVILGDQFCRNPFCEAPLILKGIGSSQGNPNAATRMEWMVAQLRQAHALEAERTELLESQCVLAERQRADEAMRHLAAIVEHSDDAIVSKNLNGVINSWNKGAERLFGYTAEEMVGQSITLLIPPERHDEEPHILERIRRGERIDHYETVRQCKDGSRVEISLTVSPLKDAEGRIIGASKIARDITKWKQAERELERARDEALAASRAKDNFLAALSHELRTPLNPVLLLASEGARNQEWSSEVRAQFEIVRKNVALEARLIDDLLDLNRITCGKLALDKYPYPAHALLQDALANVRAELDQKHITLEVHLHAHQPVIYGDAVRLQQVFWNILKNAVKFTPEAGKITIKTQVDARNEIFTLQITDTGIGMTPEELHRVFEAFQQGSANRNGSASHSGGLGLGLTIARKLAELHSGRISASSEGRDRGSTFVVELPLATAATTSSPRATSHLFQAPSQKLPGIRILLVEDHEPTRTALAYLLKRRKHEVTLATSVAEARAWVEQKHFDLLISDIGLPDGTGYELMSELRARYALKGIAMTGYGMEKDIARGRESGFIAHLVKPVLAQSLDSAIATVLSA